jgi:hypothetical protein
MSPKPTVASTVIVRSRASTRPTGSVNDPGVASDSAVYPPANRTTNRTVAVTNASTARRTG